MRARPCFIFLADLHLSDSAHTAPFHALPWAGEWIDRQRPSHSVRFEEWP